jgi:hypothetical protein
MHGEGLFILGRIHSSSNALYADSKQCTSQLSYACVLRCSSAVHAMRAALRTPERSRSSLLHTWNCCGIYRRRTCTVPLGLAYNHTCITMSERGRCPDNCESCNFDDLSIDLMFWLLLRFHVYGTVASSDGAAWSVMPSKHLVQPRKFAYERI